MPTLLADTEESAAYTGAVTPRQLRLVRGASASSAAVVVSAAAHTIGGGAPPHPLLVIGLSVFLTPVATALLGRPVRPPRLSRLSGTVVLIQAVFHLLFHFLDAALAPVGAAAAHRHGADVLAAPVPTQHVGSNGPGAELAVVLHGAVPDAGMLVAHLIAAVATVALLSRGERIARAIAGWVQATLAARMPPLSTRVGMPHAAHLAPQLPTSAARDAWFDRRGPPLPR